MTMIRVISRVPDLESSCFRAIRVAGSPGRRTREDYGRMIDSKQSSVEIALVTCHSFERIDQNKKVRQNVCVETEVIEPSDDAFSSSVSTQDEDVSTIIQNDFEKSAEFSREEEDQCRQIIREIKHDEKLLRDQYVGRNRESVVDRKQNCGDRVGERKEERCSSWWKDGGQTILHFFAKILGKRDGMDAKGPEDRVSAIGKRVKRVSRDGKNHNEHGKSIDGGARLKRVDNGYFAPNHVYRNEWSRQTTMEDKSREEQHHPSILVRQIQQTRDKNLRITLLERELRIRSFKKDKLIKNGVRQISSPLC